MKPKQHSVNIALFLNIYMSNVYSKIVLLGFLCIIFTLVSYSQKSVDDVDGISYRTIKIGTQLWMAENLNTIHYENGENIISCCYDRDTAFCRKYGRLYTWDAIDIGADLDGLTNICPTGWHVSTDEDWDIMLEFIGGFNNAGSVLRRGEYSDFNLQCGGNYQSELDIFSFIDRNTYFWTSTEYSSSAAWMRMTGANMKNVNRSTAPKEYAFSIRCVKD